MILSIDRSESVVGASRELGHTVCFMAVTGFLGLMLLLAAPAIGWAAGEQEVDPDAPAYQGETIRVVAFELAGIDEIRERLPEFEEEYGITVEFEKSSMEAARDAMMVDFSAGTGEIDVGMGSKHMSPPFIEDGHLLALDDLLASDLVEEDLLAWDDFTDAAISAVQFPDRFGEVETSTYGIPHDLLVQGLIYRESLYEKYDLEVPNTFSELRENARIIHEEEEGVAGISLRSLESPQIIWSFGQIFRAKGGRYFEDYPTNLQPTMDTQVTVDALRTFRSFFDYSPPGADNQAYTEIITQLQAGEVAQTLDDIMFSRFIEDPDASEFYDDFAYAPIPLGEGVTYDDVAFGPSVAMSNQWVINADVPEARQQAAFKFVQWATSKPMFIELMEEGAMKGMLPRESMYEVAEGESWAEAHLQAQQNASKYFRPKVPEWAELGDDLHRRVSEVVVGAISPEEAAEELQSAFVRVMRDAGRID